MGMSNDPLIMDLGGPFLFQLQYLQVNSIEK